MDINKVWLSGIALTDPILTVLPTQTPLAHFTIQVNEVYTDRDGKERAKANYLRVECLGRSSDTAMKKVKKGGRYFIDGYVRHDFLDGGEQIAVRVFALYKDKGHDGVVYKEALQQALELVQNSRDKVAAVKALEQLVSAS